MGGIINMSVPFSGSPGGDAGSSGSAWQTLANIDLSTLAAADWKTGAHTLNGAALTFDRPAATDVMGPDGSTGVVVSTTAADTDWTKTARSAPTWSVGLQDLVGVDLSIYRQIAVMLSADPTAIATTFSYWLMALETAAQSVSATALRIRQLWNAGGAGYNIAPIAGGVSSNSTTFNVVSVPQSALMVIDWRGKNVATYNALTALTGPPSDVADPEAGIWTAAGGDGARGHLFAQRSAYALGTMRLTMCVGGWATAVKSATFQRLTVQGLL